MGYWKHQIDTFVDVTLGELESRIKSQPDLSCLYSYSGYGHGLKLHIEPTKMVLKHLDEALIGSKHGDHAVRLLCETDSDAWAARIETLLDELRKAAPIIIKVSNQDREKRLKNLITLLKSTKYKTHEERRKQLGIERAQYYRDLDELEKRGQYQKQRRKT